MRIAVSWKDGGALLLQAFVMMMVATLVSAEYPPLKHSCSTCAVKEDNYRGPSWAYPCMAGYSGPKPPEVPCEGKQGCFRQLKVNGKNVVGTGGCFDFGKKSCIEEHSKQKLDDKGCTPEFELTPPIMVKLKSECGLDEPLNNLKPSEAPARRRRKREDPTVAPEGEASKVVICVCDGYTCNNKAGGIGPRSANDTNAAFAITPYSGIQIGVISGISLVGGSFVIRKQVA